jgi:Cys-rich protein (TIGR01571 family)
MVKVQSPADLEEGYQFDAVIDGQTITVTVPPGGVKEGQVFEAPEASQPPPAGTVNHPDGGQTIETRVTNPDGSVTVTRQHIPAVGGGALAVSIAPTGMWRTGLCDCFDDCCSGSFWMGWCCFPILLGQVMQRMNLSCIGTPTSDASKTCMIVTSIYVVLFILLFILDLFYVKDQQQMPGQGNLGQGGLFVFSNIMNCLFVFFLIMHMCLRNFMRKKYSIPSDCCGDCGDFCIPFWCGCCSVIQLHRHTHDEDQYPYNCGTATGLSLGAPAIV